MTPRRLNGTAAVVFAGDVMTGRGVDQILRFPSLPELHEPVVRDARPYVHLAEQVNGPIPRGVDNAYIWGDALEELSRVAADARVVNLETSVTLSDEAAPKGINYRMHPANVGCLSTAELDVCVLANNHILDYGDAGLVSTLETLARAGIQAAGAGRTLEEARRPARVTLRDGRDLVLFAVASETSGVPAGWAATSAAPGVAWVDDLSATIADALIDEMAPTKRAGDILVVSIHWGSNWGYAVPREQVRFAHRLVDGGVDVVHGHSSHHPRPIEIYAGRLILYGCGDCLTDYEGIGGHREYRSDLGLLYVAHLGLAGELTSLCMIPTQTRRMRLGWPDAGDRAWLATRLSRVSERFGSWVELDPSGALALRWTGQPNDLAPLHRPCAGIQRSSTA